MSDLEPVSGGASGPSTRWQKLWVLAREQLGDLGIRAINDIQRQGFDHASQICLRPLETRIYEMRDLERDGKLKPNQKMLLEKYKELLDEIERNLGSAEMPTFGSQAKRR